MSIATYRTIVNPGARSARAYARGWELVAIMATQLVGQRSSGGFRLALGFSWSEYGVSSCSSGLPRGSFGASPAPFWVALSSSCLRLRYRATIS